MNVGIIGLHGSGKTTIFNSLTGQMVDSDTSKGKKGCVLGLTMVPDKRLDKLTQIFKPKKTVYAKIRFTDFPGSVKDDKGFSDQTLRKLNEVDALALVLKGFSVGLLPAPLEDLRATFADMIMADLILAERAIERLKKDRREPRLLEVMTRIHEHLSNDMCLSLLKLDEHEEISISGYSFVTGKPLLVVLNTGESGDKDFPMDKIREICEGQGWKSLIICGSLEEEIAQLNTEDQNAFLADLGVEEPASERFIRASYMLMDLISFFTVGEDEVRSWPIKRGTKALKAAGKIHSDMERGFIRAEVIGYDDFIQCGDFVNAKKRGLLRLEGKDYQVSDGDIISFRFNV
jgi:GTP-binding protein YchF